MKELKTEMVWYNATEKLPSQKGYYLVVTATGNTIIAGWYSWNSNWPVYDEVEQEMKDKGGYWVDDPGGEHECDLSFEEVIYWAEFPKGPVPPNPLSANKRRDW